MEKRARTGPVGRILRLLLGAALIVWAIPPPEAPASAILLSVATAVALLVFYLLVHWALARRVRRLGTWSGVLIAVGSPALIFFLGLPGGLIFGRGEGAVAVILYIGVSLIVMAVRADPGCEVMALPNVILGKESYLPCFLFSPIDALERRLRAGRATPNEAAESGVASDHRRSRDR